MSFTYFYNTVFGGDPPNIPAPISNFLGNKLNDWNISPSLPYDGLRNAFLSRAQPPPPPPRVFGSYKFTNRVLQGDQDHLKFHPGRSLFREIWYLYAQVLETGGEVN